MQHGAAEMVMVVGETARLVRIKADGEWWLSSLILADVFL